MKTNNFNTFIFKETSIDGYSIVAGGIYSNCAENEVIKLASKFKKFKINLIDDPFYVDYILADFVKKNCPESFCALGVSIHLPGIASQTGGIIGNPHKESSSAEGISEDIGNGFSVAGYPGGPGIVICGSISEAEEVLRVANPGDYDRKTLNKIILKAKKLGVDTLIIITDGTGNDSQGCVITLENKQIKRIYI